jgi:hypothetical protein
MRQPIPLLLLSLFICNQLAASALSWDRTEVNLKMEPDQEEIRASFKVTNEGDERIRIARVKTSCGCTGSIIDRKILEPGNSTEIIGTFNKGKRQGLNRNRLEVFIDSQPEAVTTLRMNVQIPELVAVTPTIVYWNPSSSKTERRVAITLDEDYVDKILRIEYDRDQLNVTEEEDPAGKATLLLRIAPKSYDTQYRGMVTVFASGKNGRKAEARIHAFIQP